MLGLLFGYAADMPPPVPRRRCRRTAVVSQNGGARIRCFPDAATRPVPAWIAAGGRPRGLSDRDRLDHHAAIEEEVVPDFSIITFDQQEPLDPGTGVISKLLVHSGLGSEG
jgi:hypothetical protein